MRATHHRDRCYQEVTAATTTQATTALVAITLAPAPALPPHPLRAPPQPAIRALAAAASYTATHEHIPALKPHKVPEFRHYKRALFARLPPPQLRLGQPASCGAAGLAVTLAAVGVLLPVPQGTCTSD